MRILVIGGYGLIGAAVVRHLLEAGHDVVGLGRDTAKAERQLHLARWIAVDLATLVTPDAWASILGDAWPDAIVNCAGALQDGLRDNVAAVQATAMCALFDAVALRPAIRVVQISAPRADAGAATEFMRSKGRADAHLRASSLDWTILRPGLVLAPQAYGGTALLRALAAMPLVVPLVHGDRLVQTVAVTDVAVAVLGTIEGRVPRRHIYDLVEDEPHALGDIVRQMRAWLGLPPGRVVQMPPVLVRAVAKVADALGWLGWRSPMRSTTLAEIAANVTGDAAPWREATGQPLASLDVTLRRMPATIQELWFARLFLLKPLAIAMLSLFWITSGLIALVSFDAAVAVLTTRGMDGAIARLLVAGGVVLDLGLGLAVLVRRTVRLAAAGMIALTIIYLAAASLLAHDLWLDPLGPLVKTLPGIGLALLVLALAEDR